MRVVTFTELRKKFEELGTAAENGEVILVTRYGKPVIELRPIVKEPDAPPVQDTP